MYSKYRYFCCGLLAEQGRWKCFSSCYHANLSLLIFLVKLLPFFQPQSKVIESSVYKISNHLAGSGNTKLIYHFVLKVYALFFLSEQYLLKWILSTPSLRGKEYFYKVLTKVTDNLVWDLIFHYHLILSKKWNHPQKLLFIVYTYKPKKFLKLLQEHC